MNDYKVIELRLPLVGQLEILSEDLSEYKVIKIYPPQLILQSKELKDYKVRGLGLPLVGQFLLLSQHLKDYNVIGLVLPLLGS